MLQLRTSHTGHLHIKQNTGRLASWWHAKQTLCGLVERNSIATSAQQVADSHAERCVIVDYMNDWRQVRHSAAALDNGSVKRNTAPFLGRFSAHIRPPYVWTIVREMNNPSPVPCRFVV